MPELNPDTTTSQPDIQEAVAEISSELFGQNDEGSEDDSGSQVETPEGETQEVTPESGGEGSPSGDESGENSEAVQAVGAPSTWSKEALEEWATIPERAKQEILKREEDMFRGLAEYKGRAEFGDQFQQVLSPYKEVMEKAQVDPIQMTQSFAANHYALSFGTPDQKAQLAANLLTGYGIDLNLLADILSTPIDPKIQQLEQRITQLSQGQQQQNNQALEARAAAEVEAFAKDKPYFDELQVDIAKFINQGESLQDAYDKAVYANPVTRQKEIDRLTAEKLAERESVGQQRADKIARSRAADVSALPRQRDGTVPLGSMDDTLNETLAAMQSRS